MSFTRFLDEEFHFIVGGLHCNHAVERLNLVVLEEMVARIGPRGRIFQTRYTTRIFLNPRSPALGLGHF